MRVIQLIFLALPFALQSATVTLVPSAASPAPLGTVVTFEANVNDATASYAYRFRTRRAGTRMAQNRDGIQIDPGYRTVIDFGPKQSLEWTTIAGEGAYEIEVTARNNATGETTSETARFEFTRLATRTPTVTRTEHPLVFIYSAPPCAEGGLMRARFAETGSGSMTETPELPCDGESTMNFYLAGMRAATEHRAWHTLATAAGTVESSHVTFATGPVTITTPAAVPMSTPIPDYAGILLQGTLMNRPTATDLNGNLLWYGPTDISMFTRVGAGGTMLGIFESGALPPERQYFREYNLAGITVAETNAARVSEQLRAYGARPITSFHHEAIRMPDGRYLLLAGSEQGVPNAAGDGTVSVLGDTIVLLDRDLQLLWYWDSFEHMDLGRKSVLGETCNYPASLACSTFYENALAEDWLHGNSLQVAPDGNIIYSIRHQDWVAKIDFQNGAGTGAVLWRLGPEGDFQLAEGDESAWFSHQHDALMMPDGVTLILFDNGNTRIARSADQGTSRGQVWRLDEETRTAHLVTNADLLVNAAALGSAQLLPNGNYHFNAGFIPNPANRNQRITQALEVEPGGNIVWGMQINAQQYRNFRLDDLYTPPRP
jgi:arylsulfate sulfotransferase